MSEHIGEVYQGIISGFTAMNVFVELPNTVEGAISVSNLTDDFYFYNEQEYAMIGERTGRRFSLGDRVEIRVLKCDKLNRTIDFVLNEDQEEEEENEASESTETKEAPRRKKTQERGRASQNGIRKPADHKKKKGAVKGGKGKGKPHNRK
jgi:ribonuclease R